MQKNKLSSFLNIFSIGSALLVPIVALLGFLPIAPLGIDGTKIIVGCGLVILALVTYIASSIINKAFVLPHRLVLAGSGIFAATYVVSSFFTGMTTQSLFGLGIDMWTGTSLTLFLVYLLLVSVHAQEANVRRMFVRVLSVTAGIAVVFQVLRFVTLGAIHFSVFQNNITINTVGRWFDFGFVALALLIASLAYVVTKSLTRVQRIVAWALVLIGFVGVCIVSSSLLALLLAISATVLYVHAKKVTDQTRHDTAARAITLGIASIAGIMFVFQLFTAQSILFFQGSQVPNLASTSYNIMYRDYPANFLSETITVLKSTLAVNPVFGVGLNQFGVAWTQYKSAATNSVQNAQWWGTDFSYGFGLPLTMLGMTGILGLLGLIIFVVFTTRTIWISRARTGSTQQCVVVLIGGLGLAYIVVHTPSAGLLLFLLTIWGIATSYAEGKIAPIANTGTSTLGVLVLILILVVPVYGFVSRAIYLVQGMTALQVVNTPEAVNSAIKKIESIAKTNTHSTYYQSLATLEQIKATQIANKIRVEEKTLSQTQIQTLTTELTKSYENVDRALRGAIAVDPKNYNGYVEQAQFLGALAQLPAESEKEKVARDARYTEAVKNLEKARVLAPQNPNIDVLQAQLDIQQKNYKEAQVLLLKAIEKRPAFTDPVLLLAQLYAGQNNLADARSAAEYAVRTNTSNPQALYIYGQLEKEAKNYAGAAQAFERIVALQGNNVSPEIAKLLADTYAAAGATAQAKAIYEQILKADPKNIEVEQIINQIQSRDVIPEVQNQKETIVPVPKKR